MTDTFIAFFEHLPQAACIIDSEGRIVAWNPAMQTLTHCAPQDALNASLAELDGLPGAIFTFWQGIAAGGEAAFETVRNDDRAYTAHCNPLPDAHWMILAEPSTTQTTAAKTDLMNMVAHDLQSPLAAIKGFADLVLHSGPLEDRQKHFIGRITRTVGEMSDLISRLLDMSWVDSNAPMELSAVNLAHMTNNLAAGFMTRAEEQKVNLKLELERVPEIECDERRMRQVVNNLMGNAIKYSLDGGDVTVRVFADDSRVSFEVSDQGVGIPAEFHEKIFERFFRVPGEHSRKIEGNGLGLAISYEVLRRHGVTLHVESEPEKGSRFFFSMPVKTD
jgi:signal transduction histidine kinase